MLETKVNAIIEEIEVMEKNLMGMFSLSDLAEADDETMQMFKSYANLLTQSKELMVEQAKVMDNTVVKLNSIEEKLVLLLNK